MHTNEAILSSEFKRKSFSQVAFPNRMVLRAKYFSRARFHAREAVKVKWLYHFIFDFNTNSGLVLRQRELDMIFNMFPESEVEKIQFYFK